MPYQYTQRSNARHNRTYEEPMANYQVYYSCSYQLKTTKQIEPYTVYEIRNINCYQISNAQTQTHATHIHQQDCWIFCAKHETDAIK